MLLKRLIAYLKLRDHIRSLKNDVEQVSDNFINLARAQNELDIEIQRLECERSIVLPLFAKKVLEAVLHVTDAFEMVFLVTRPEEYLTVILEEQLKNVVNEDDIEIYLDVCEYEKDYLINFLLDKKEVLLNHFLERLVNDTAKYPLDIIANPRKTCSILAKILQDEEIDQYAQSAFMQIFAENQSLFKSYFEKNKVQILQNILKVYKDYRDDCEELYNTLNDKSFSNDLTLEEINEFKARLEDLIYSVKQNLAEIEETNYCSANFLGDKFIESLIHLTLKLKDILEQAQNLKRDLFRMQPVAEETSDGEEKDVEKAGPEIELQALSETVNDGKSGQSNTPSSVGQENHTPSPLSAGQENHGSSPPPMMEQAKPGKAQKSHAPGLFFQPIKPTKSTATTGRPVLGEVAAVGGNTGPRPYSG